MKIRQTVAASVIALFAFGGVAQASTFLYNTGFDTSGNEIPLATIAADGNWTVSGTGTGIQPNGSTYASVINGTFPQGPWVPDSSTSRWITPTDNAADSFDPSANGTYEFTETFTLTAAQVATASFTGQFAADNFVDSISLNGASIYSNAVCNVSTCSNANNSDYESWTAFAANAGFVAGTNTLTFEDINFAQNGGNPAGLDVQFLSESAGVPEPATWAMFLIGFGGIGFMMRNARRRSAAATA
jgi:hypothetical protein